MLTSHAPEPEIAHGKRREELLFYPNPYNTGYEFTERMLKEKRLSRSLTDEECSRRRRALKLLCHLEGESEEDLGDQGTIPLEEGSNTNPQQALKDQRNQVIFSQAPAGTEETHTIALYLSALLKHFTSADYVAIGLVTAPTNLAVRNIVRELCRVNKGEIHPREILEMQSPLADRKY